MAIFTVKKRFPNEEEEISLSRSMSILPVFVALIALFISGITFYFTYLQKSIDVVVAVSLNEGPPKTHANTISLVLIFTNRGTHPVTITKAAIAGTEAVIARAAEKLRPCPSRRNYSADTPIILAPKESKTLILSTEVDIAAITKDRIKQDSTYLDSSFLISKVCGRFTVVDDDGNEHWSEIVLAHTWFTHGLSRGSTGFNLGEGTHQLIGVWGKQTSWER